MKIFTYIKDQSERVPRKNFQKIGGLELWKHLLYRLKEYEVYIDTDSEEVLKECSVDPLLQNVICYPRKKKFVVKPSNEANQLSPALNMTENFLDTYVSNPDEAVVVTHVTSPFLTKKTIENALQYLKKGYEFVHSIHSIQDFAWYGDAFEPLNFDPAVVQRTQDIDKIYFSNGAFFIFTKRSFKKHNTRLGDNSFYYPLDRVEAIEIDTMEDLRLAKLVHRGKKND